MGVVFCQLDSPPPVLLPDETHVYTVPLVDADAMLAFLTEDEQGRAGRLRLARVREQFVAARGRLRCVLGHYLQLEPRRVPILYADGGKPYLPSEFGTHFNLSHSDHLAVIALARVRVGVDVERVRLIPNAEGLVSRYFSQRECAEFQEIPIEHRPVAFFRAWTRKEAVLKAMGRGVGSLDCCEVTFTDEEFPRLRTLDGDEAASENWELYAWQPAEGYLAAVASEANALSWT